MKWIKYQIVCNSSDGVLLEKKIGYSDANLELARAESYNGEYEIINDEKIVDFTPYSKLSDDTLYVTKTNENPSAYLGGTWELVDKYLSRVYYNSTSNPELVKAVGNYCDYYNFDIVVEGHDIFVSVTYSLTQDSTETNFNVITLDFLMMGISKLSLGANFFASSDDANGVACLTLSASTGLIQQYDFNGKAGNTAGLPKDARVQGFVELKTAKWYIDDDYCDKFFWKKISDQQAIDFIVNGVHYAVAPDTTWRDFVGNELAHNNEFICEDEGDFVWYKDYQRKVSDPTHRKVNGGDIIEAVEYYLS